MATTTTKPEVQTPVEGDVNLRIPLRDQLKGMTRPRLVEYASDRFAVTISDKLTVPAIIDELCRMDDNIRKGAQDESEASAKMSIGQDDPPITIVFHNMQTVDEDITFSFAGPRGMRGPKNENGHKKCPRYHLFPGMQITLPYSVVEHLRTRICTRHKAIFDPITGMQSGTEPIISPRFLLEQRISKEEALMLEELRNKKSKE